MDKSNVIFRNAFIYELLLYIVVDGECAGRQGDNGVHIGGDRRIFSVRIAALNQIRIIVIRPHRFFLPKKRAVHIHKGLKLQVWPYSLIGGNHFSRLGRGEIAEYKLCALVRRRIAPDFVDAIHGNIDFRAGMITRSRVNQAKVQTRFAGVIGDFERIIHTRVAGQMLHTLDNPVHVFRLIRRPFHDIVKGFTALHRRRERP